MKFGLSEEIYKNIKTIAKRYDERKKDYHNAVLRLEEAIKVQPTTLEIDGILHRFEFTFELAWKTLKDYLEYMGFIEKIGSPREVIQTAFKQGVIQNGEEWIDMMLSRNTLSHLYDEEESRKIYVKVQEQYVSLLKELDEKFENIL